MHGASFARGPSGGSYAPAGLYDAGAEAFSRDLQGHVNKSK